MTPNEQFVYAAGYTNDLQYAIFHQSSLGILHEADSMYTGANLNRGLLYTKSIASNDGKFLYLASNQDQSIVAYDVSSNTGLITLVNRIDRPDPAFASYGRPVLSPDGQFLYLPANNGDSLQIFRRDALTGAISYASSLPFLSLGYNVLQIAPSGMFAYIIGHGSNQVRIYSRNPVDGTLTPIGIVNSFNSIPFSEIIGMSLPPDGKSLHILTYISTISYSIDKLFSFTVDAGSGSLNQVQELELPVLRNLWSSPDGLNLLSIAGGESLRVFRRDALTGNVEDLQTVAIRNNHSGNFRIQNANFTPDGNFLFASTERSIQVFKRDLPAGGVLRYIGMQMKEGGLSYSESLTSMEESYSFDPAGPKVIGVRPGGGGIWAYNMEASFPPSAPFGFSAQNGLDKVVLSWQPNFENNITAYEIYSTSGNTGDPVNAVKIGETSGTTFNYSGPNAFTFSSYCAKARNSNGEVSEFSEVARTIAVDEPPSAPTGGAVTPGDRFIKLTWNVNTEGDFKQYRVYLSLSNDPVSSQQLAITTNTTYTDNDVAYGQLYFYWLKAEDQHAHLSDFSTFISAMPTNLPPSAPVNVTAQSGDKYVTVSWNANSEPDKKDYLVSRSYVNNPATSQVVSTVSATTYQDINVNYYLTYYYWVRAEDLGGEMSSYSNSVSGTPVNLPPTAPQNVSIAGGDKYINLSWTANSETDLQLYVIYRNSVNDPATAQQVSTAYSVAYLDTDVDYDHTYYYWIKAEDVSTSLSPVSSMVSGSPLNNAPSVPQNVSITSGDKYIDLSWTANAEPDFGDYQVYRNTSTIRARHSSSRPPTRPRSTI